MTAALGLLLWAGQGIVRPDFPPDSLLPCVPCHGDGENDQFAEWLASPYSQVEGGQGCVDCHAGRCAGSDSDTSDGHAPSARPRIAGAAAQLTVTAICSGDAVLAEVVVANLGTGHHLPTGPPARKLVLEVTARGQNGRRLLTSPHPGRSSSTGVSTPGRIFLKYVPPGSCSTYRPRLVPFQTDVSSYRFASTGGGPARVTARLLLDTASGSPMEMATTTTECHAAGVTP